MYLDMWVWVGLFCSYTKGCGESGTMGWLSLYQYYFTAGKILLTFPLVEIYLVCNLCSLIEKPGLSERLFLLILVDWYKTHQQFGTIPKWAPLAGHVLIFMNIHISSTNDWNSDVWLQASCDKTSTDSPCLTAETVLANRKLNLEVLSINWH